MNDVYVPVCVYTAMSHTPISNADRYTSAARVAMFCIC